MRLKVLQIAAGSMGTRRLRDLSARADVELALFEPAAPRRERAAANFGVTTFAELEPALAWGAQALSISTPPHRHEPFVKLALDRGLHHFCEADIWTPPLEPIERAIREKRLVAAPSCSLHFLPVVRQLKRVVREELGRLHAYQMVLNTYQPDWHPGEGPDYYARQRNTAAGREMVPFELLWLDEVFGAAVEAAGTVTRAGSLQGGPEDTWSVQMKLESGAAGQLMVLMGCPGALRHGWCFGEAGQVQFDLFSGDIWRTFRAGDVDDGQNYGQMKQVLEQAYAEEIGAFVEAVTKGAVWPQSYRQASAATATLAAAERSARTGRREDVILDLQPEHLLT
jgi:predicted dehydrogenase